MSKPKIVAKAVTKKKELMGWKVYIDGSKFPKKPVDFYAGLTDLYIVSKHINYLLRCGVGLHPKRTNIKKILSFGDGC